jgi:hypothetical protein
MEQLPDLVSLYTAELGAIYLALRHGVGSTRVTFIICVDLMSCVQPIGTFSIKNPTCLQNSAGYRDMLVFGAMNHPRRLPTLL